MLMFYNCYNYFYNNDIDNNDRDHNEDNESNVYESHILPKECQIAVQM